MHVFQYVPYVPGLPWLVPALLRCLDLFPPLKSHLVSSLLAASKEPMNAKEMIEAMAAKKLWTSPGGATPLALSRWSKVLLQYEF